MANNKKDLEKDNQIKSTTKKNDGTKAKSNTRKNNNSSTSKAKSTNINTKKSTNSNVSNKITSKSPSKKNTTTKTTPKKASTNSKTTTSKTKASNNQAKTTTKKNSTTIVKKNSSNNNSKKSSSPKVQNKVDNNIKIESVEITEIPRIEQIEYITVKKRKLNKKNLVLLIILLISIICLFIALFNVIFWFIDNRNINKQIDDINYVTKVEVINDNENTEIIEQDNINKSDPYWDYIKMDMINVDFNELLRVNKDTKGWLQVNGTNVNYPFVQTTNNDYYLTHAFDKSWNDAGWVFLDYRNNISNRDKNTIIYGHSRLNKTMFGSLKNILTSGWLNNTDNYVIKLSTEYENTLWQIFSVYHIPTNNDYIQTEFEDNSEFYTFATMLLNRSQHNFNTTISENDQILTLSTCYKNDEKLAIHAKLIKKELR